MARRIAVTGANGFVGRHVVEAARAAGWDVAAVVRSSSSAAIVESAGATAHVLPALEAGALAAAFTGAEAVAHLAQIGAEGPSTYEEVNVEGTRQVAAAALAAGVPRVAFFSGLGVAHYGMAPRTTSRYFLSKLAAELALFASGLSVAVFRPSYIVGPGDGLVRALTRDLAAGVIERPGDGSYRMQPIAVSDGAAAILAAAGGDPVLSGRPHHRVYDLVGPEAVTYDGFVRRLAARSRARGWPSEYVVRSVPVEEADRQARAGGYRGMHADELDCMLCDEVSDPAPLAALLGRALLPLDAAIDLALGQALGS